MGYLGSEPADHKTADAASTEWAVEIRDRIHPGRVGLARAALFALFRLSAEERAVVFRVFCRRCGDHSAECYCE